MKRLPRLKARRRKYFGDSIYLYYSYEQVYYTTHFVDDLDLLTGMYGDNVTTTDFDESLDWCAIVIDRGIFMKKKKQDKTDAIVESLQNANFYVEVNANGHIRVNGWDFWCTTEKFRNAKTGESGQHLSNFINVLGINKNET